MIFFVPFLRKSYADVKQTHSASHQQLQPGGLGLQKTPAFKEKSLGGGIKERQRARERERARAGKLLNLGFPAHLATKTTDICHGWQPMQPMSTWRGSERSWCPGNNLGGGRGGLIQVNRIGQAAGWHWTWTWPVTGSVTGNTMPPFDSPGSDFFLLF